MASIRNAEIETTAIVKAASLEKEIAVGKATTHQLLSQLRVI